MRQNKVITNQEDKVIGLTGREKVRTIQKERNHRCNLCAKSICGTHEYIKTFSAHRNARYYHFECLMQEYKAGRVELKQGDAGYHKYMDERPHLFLPQSPAKSAGDLKK